MNRIWLKFGRSLRCDILCPVRSFNQNYGDFENDPFGESSSRNNAESEGKSSHHSQLLFQPSLSHYVGLLGVGVVVGVKIDHLQRTSDFFQIRRNHSLACPFVTKAGPINVAPHFPKALSRPLAILDSDECSFDCVDAHSSDQVNSKANEITSPTASPQLQPSLGSESSSIKEDLSHLAIAYADTLCNLIGVRLIQANQTEGIDYLLSSPNYSRALFNLAVSYETGQFDGKSNGQPDPVLAFEYYQRSSELGHDYATYNLSLYYLYGKYPAKRDVSKGVNLLEKAFSLGVQEASVYRKMRQFVTN